MSSTRAKPQKLRHQPARYTQDSGRSGHESRAWQTHGPASPHQARCRKIRARRMKPTDNSPLGRRAGGGEALHEIQEIHQSLNPGAIYVTSSRRETCETGKHEQSSALHQGKTTETKAPAGKIDARQRRHSGRSTCHSMGGLQHGPNTATLTGHLASATVMQGAPAGRRCRQG